MKGTMTTMIAAALAVVAMTPTPAAEAAEAEPVCVTVEITHPDGPKATNIDWTEGAPRTHLVGHFVWFDWSGIDGGSSGEVDTLSFDVSDPGIVSAVGCSDGSVTLEHSQAEPESGQTDTGTGGPEPSEGTEGPLGPICEVYADTLARYCTLPNRSLVIS